MACAIALMSSSFLACESNFSFHPESLLSSLSFSTLKVFLFDRPTREGNPK